MSKIERNYAIGDIHGCANALTDLLGQIAQDWRETETEHETPVIVTLGDYVDRGPDIPRVLEILSKGSYEGIPIISLIGNHDWVLRFFLEDGKLPEKVPELMKQFDPDLTFYQGCKGYATLEQYGIGTANCFDFFKRFEEIRTALRQKMPAHHRKFLAELKDDHATKTHFFVHAGIDWQLGPKETPSLLKQWIRDDFLDVDCELPQMIVHGHSIRGEADLNPYPTGRVNLDTGCFKTGVLTCGVFGETQRQPLRTLISLPYHTPAHANA